MKQLKTSKKQNSKRNNQLIMKLPQQLTLNKIDVEIEFTKSIYLRSGQTSVSYATGSQIKSFSLSDIISTSNNFTKYVTSGIANFEYLRVTGFALTWFPAMITPVTGTFEPEAFDIRYLANYASDTQLPTGYSGNYNKAHYDVLLQQTVKPKTMIFGLKNLPYLLSDTGAGCLGQMINGYTFVNFANNIGGILTLIQTTPAVNTIASYNPKLGFIEVKIHVELYNSIV